MLYFYEPITQFAIQCFIKKCEIAEKIDIKSVYDLHSIIVRQFPPHWIHPKIGPYTGVIVPQFIEFNGLCMSTLVDCISYISREEGGWICYYSLSHNIFVNNSKSFLYMMFSWNWVPNSLALGLSLTGLIIYFMV